MWLVKICKGYVKYKGEVPKCMQAWLGPRTVVQNMVNIPTTLGHKKYFNNGFIFLYEPKNRKFIAIHYNNKNNVKNDTFLMTSGNC